MLVTMLAQISGLRDGKPWPPRGHSIDLPDDEAIPLLQRQVAVPATDPETGVELALRDTVPVEVRVQPADVVAENPQHPLTRKRVKQ